MLFEDRNQAVIDLMAIEKAYPVQRWKLNGIHLWPILKRELFFFEFAKLQKTKEKKAGRSLVGRSLALLKTKTAAYYQLFTLKLHPSDFVFAGAPAHRVTWNGKAYNRYFDPIITYLRSKNVNSYLTEYYPIDKKTVFHPDNFIAVATLYPAFKKSHPLRQDWLKLVKEPVFQDFLLTLRIKFPDYEQDLEKKLLSVVDAIASWRDLYLYLFKQTKPRYAVGLCYYTHALFGMNVAADELGIISVDMQHGGQGELHPAYTFFKVPKEGYNTLPKEFWCWDSSSYGHIKSWTKGKAHQVKLIGNPWFSFLKETEKSFEGNFTGGKKLILFSHQPVVPALDLYLIQSIKETRGSYQWWIRLHPRISKAEKEAIEILLKGHGIFESVELKKATQLPLPIILNQTAVHLSKYSGTIIESIMSGVPTIILGEVGHRTFSQFIEEGKAIGIREPTTEQLNQALAKSILWSARKNTPTVDYKQFINDYLNKHQHDQRNNFKAEKDP